MHPSVTELLARALSVRAENLGLRFVISSCVAEILRPRLPTTGSVHELASHDRLGHTLVADVRHSCHTYRSAVCPAAPGLHFHIKPELVARNHGAAEFGTLNPGKDHQLLVAILHFGQQQCAASLRNGFHHQHPRHDRHPGKMPGKERLVNGDILDGHDSLLALEVNHTVDQQEWEPVRQDAKNIVDVQRSLSRRRSLDGGVCRLVPAEMARRLRYFEERRDDIVATTRQLVEIESPSDNKQAVDQLGALLAGRFEGLGGHAKFHHAQNFGDHLQVDFAVHGRGKPVLLLGHIDTVYPLGTLGSMPCRVADGRLWGPGALDMKSGIALMLHAIQALRAWHGDTLPLPVTVLLVSDEEVGSDSSRHITESLAKKSAAVLVLEPSYGLHGAVKTARKGVGEYKIKVTGKAAHSGLDFEKGESAIVELAKQITEISKLIDLKRGLTLNVGLVQGGTRVNVIPAEATASLDVRIARMKDAAGIDRALRSLKSFNRKCKLEITGAINRPPMERTAGVAALYKKATEIARQLGWKLEEAAVGGGSDGNFTAGLGIPTLDGLGGVGEGAHAAHESIVISELPKRAALLAELIESV